MPDRLITLLTDFGHADPYVGVMKGVILGIEPTATIVDLTHDISPQDVLQGAFLLGTAWRHFPPGTIHVAVVDPAVGTDRKALLVQGQGHTFLAPDNGLLSFALPGEEVSDTPFQPYQSRMPSGFSAHALTNPQYWRHPVSSTFHGRDIFAPVAAHLSAGVSTVDLGEPIETLTRLAVPTPRRHGKEMTGHVIHIDRFGNVVTTLSEGHIPRGGKPLTIEIGDRRIDRLSETYAAEERLVALIGSHGNLEVAARNGSAAELLGVTVGDEVLVTSG